MQDPVVASNYQSSLATFARRLDPSLLTTLRLDPSTVLMVEAIVSLCKVLTNDSDGRPWQERIEACFSGVTDGQANEILAAFAEEAKEPKKWFEKYGDGSYRKFVERLLGAKEYRLLTEALKEDGAAVALAIRRGVRALAPFAVAWNDAVNLMSKDQLKAVTKADVLGMNAVQLLIGLDDILGEKVLKSLPMEATTATPTDLSEWAPGGTEPIVMKFRSFVTEASTKRVERANSALVRKIQGARHVLEGSEDGVSQAAHSLTELIDRIMRESFPPKTVLTWVEENLPDEPQLTFLDRDGKKKPTKRGEALCLLYAGGPVPLREASEYDKGSGPSLIHSVLALALSTARNKLQDLKHADKGTPEESEQLLIVFSALEGALMLGLTLGKYPADSAETPEVSAA